MIYLDHAATTHPHRDVGESMQPYLETHYHNPSASYATEETSAVANARQSVAELLGATPERVVFTGGGSEADNLAIKGAIDAADGEHVVTTTIEHSAVIETCDWLEENGVDVTRVQPGEDGRVDPADVEDAIRPETTIVSVMHANNETGVIQPLEAIGEITDEYDVRFHSDTVQSAGKIPIDVDDLGLDMASLSAHKFYGPNGVGALYVRDGVELEPLIHGGGQEFGLRSGTENVAGLVGMGTAADLAVADLEERRERLTDLRAEFVARVTGFADAKLIGHPERRLPGYAMLCFPNRTGSDLIDALAERDIAVSGGSACHSGDPSPSRVLLEMGIDPELSLGAVRFSMGRATTENDVERVTEALREILKSA
ncbi:cysteine desulfurase family protein [Halapricum hydrolyticum]|uniref:cysteine desulfurase n=2 Tax=Halapricum hydrolyticum TaxID=2979991 RepID=A0AAE3LET8_9EURY|nr:cysteine desulfurase family protein [Halapricum hydrolyticum]MCU4717674.1 cysteine desulfurase [Halapricum hydrolyticum]MCU4726797.1 cysteine desulfurase [Halapricum hydrolyticum]